jgi:hypothetical protein
MKAMAMGWVLLAIGLAGGPYAVAAWSAEEKADSVVRWEYRVLSKEKVLELGKKDLAAGLNKLGDEGWELAAVDSAYIFKRARNQNRWQAADLKRRISLIESDVEMRRDRVLWAERMAKKGFMTNQNVEGERRALRIAEAALERTRRELEAIPGGAKGPAEKERKPEK